MKTITRLTTLLAVSLSVAASAWADVPFTATTSATEETGSEEVTITIDKTTGTATKTDGTTVTSGWFRYWTSSNENPQIKLDAGANNMTYSANNIIAYVGSLSAATQTYTISTTSTDYVIAGYSFDFTMAASTSITVSGGGQTFKSSSTSQTLSVTGVYGSEATFTISDSNNGITLTNFVVTLIPASSVPLSAEQFTSFQEMITRAETALSKRGPLYPTEDCEAYTTLQAAIAEAKTLTSDNATLGDYNALETAFFNYNSTSDIQMPEDGKAYTISFKMYDGETRLMYLSGTGENATYTLATSTPTDEQKKAGILVCRKQSDGTYVFVNNEGGYFAWKGNAKPNTRSGSTGTFYDQFGVNDNRGWQESCTSDSSNCSTFTISKIVEGSYVGTGTQESLLGCVYLTTDRPNHADGQTARICFVSSENANATSGLYYDGASVPFFNASFSSALIFEEVTYPNHPTLNVPGIEGVATIGTFSAPFPTVIPEGVTAYTVTDTGNGVATLTAVAGEAIPANTGVILTGNAAENTSALMVPATSETAATITGNLLSHTAGADLTVAEGNTTIYVLTKPSTADVAKFYLSNAGTLSMNKAYLNLDSATGGAPSLTLNFGEATGIETAVTEEANAPVRIYDLSGRRVQKAVKGLYIMDGKKVYVK